MAVDLVTLDNWIRYDGSGASTLDGLVVETLSEIISSQTAAAPDNNFAYAVCLAIDKIAQKNQGIRNYRAYTALVTIMQGNYTRKVKDKAFEVLQNLKEYS